MLDVCTCNQATSQVSIVMAGFLTILLWGWVTGIAMASGTVKILRNPVIGTETSD